MAMHNYDRIILAEDDMARAREMREILEQIGTYDVRGTKLKSEVMNLLEETTAGWLILDLNLEDGNASDLVPLIREKYGNKVFIIILSGYFEDYPEHDLLSRGADLYLRKPYRPKALLMQMETLRARMEGVELKHESGVKLKIGNGVLDMEKGIYKAGNRETTITSTQSKLIEILASARDEDGWSYVNRAQVVTYVWGEDLDADPMAYGQRLRKMRHVLGKNLGVDILEVLRGGRRGGPNYRLSSEVIFLEE